MLEMGRKMKERDCDCVHQKGKRDEESGRHAMDTCIVRRKRRTLEQDAGHEDIDELK